jgi:hypothetical protein
VASAACLLSGTSPAAELAAIYDGSDILNACVSSAPLLAPTLLLQQPQADMLEYGQSGMSFSLVSR